MRGNNKGMSRSLAWLLGTAAAVAVGAPAAGQEANDACANAPAGSPQAQDCARQVNRAAEDTGQIGDIVVTARKRAENLQDVPDTITAFSEQVIDERRLDQIDDFLGLTPNVNITADQDAATNNISIRGLGSNRNQAAAVAFSVDGVILPDADAFTMDLSDVERVEVLKGPQGALYGKGAIAGAINITTQRPTNRFEGEAKASYESGDMLRVFGSLSGPIVEDKVLGRISALYRKGDGTIENQFNDRPINPIEQFKVSGRLVVRPSDALEFDLRGSYFDETTGSLYFSLFDALGTTNGEITEEIAGRDPNLDGPSISTRTVTDFSLLVNLDTPIGTLTSISAYDRIKVDFREDLDISRFPLVPNAHQNRDTEGYSQELRITSPGNQPLRYIAGLYYQKTTRITNTDAVLDLCLFTGTCLGPGGFTSAGTLPLILGNFTVGLNQYSAFGQLSYDVTAQIELTAALRYDDVNGRLNDRLAGVTQDAEWSKLQPKFTVAYRPTDDITAYAVYSQGFKAGNFNQVAAGPGFPRVVENEVSKNYEVGLKTSLLNRRLRANFAAFYTQHLNPQIFQLDPATVGQGTLNAQEVRIKGFEVELTARPTPNWDLDAAFGYIDAEIEDFNGIDNSYVGQQLPNAPKFTLNVGTGYRMPLTEGINARARVDLKTTGRESFQDFQFPADPEAFLFQKSVTTVDAQLGLEGEQWGLTFFARNLFDRRHATSAFSRYIFPVALVPLGSDAIQPDPGRILGAELRVRF